MTETAQIILSGACGLSFVLVAAGLFVSAVRGRRDTERPPR